MTNCFSAMPSRKASRKNPGNRSSGTEVQQKYDALLRRRITIAQARWQTIRALAGIVFKLIAKMLRIVGILFASGIRIGQRRMPRQRLDAESVGSVEIEILLEAVRVEKVIAHPSCGKRGQIARVEIQLDAFAGAKYDKAIVSGAEQIEHIARARVVPCGARVGSSHTAVRERVRSVACRSKTNFARIAKKFERSLGEGNFGGANFLCVGSLIDANRVPINFQIGDDANAPRPPRQFSAKARSHAAFNTSAAAHAFDNASPFVVCTERFYIRRHDFYSCLISGVHRCSGEIVSVAVDDQTQRFRHVPFAEVERDPVEFREAGEW